MDKRYFSEKIVKWYENNQRELPWRLTKDPYKIWLSEIILQQTRVSQGLPYYQRFLKSYPSIRQLAAAPEQEVLRLWQGLGYYTRARNLHKCAREVVEKFGGRFPDNYEQILTLPGIGSYTAAAIASFSFHESIAVLDGNVFRLLSRIFGLDDPINSPEGKKRFSILANELITDKTPDLHNQAVMEFGATVCTPKNPSCNACVFIKNCFAYEKGLREQLPVKLKSKPSRRRYFYYIVFEHRDSLLMRRREMKDIWTGLFDFHLVEKNRPVKTEKIVDEISELVNGSHEITISKRYKHVLTHQTIFSKFVIIKTKKKPVVPAKNQAFYSFAEIHRLPKPVLVSRFLAEHYPL